MVWGRRAGTASSKHYSARLARAWPLQGNARHPAGQQARSESGSTSIFQTETCSDAKVHGGAFHMLSKSSSSLMAGKKRTNFSSRADSLMLERQTRRQSKQPTPTDRPQAAAPAQDVQVLQKCLSCLANNRHTGYAPCNNALAWLAKVSCISL